MESNPENRKKTRFVHKSKITLETGVTGVHRDARMLNFSEFGLYFETDFQLQLETEIRIGISNSPFAVEPDTYESYSGVVRWRKELKKSSYYYGYGVELIAEDAVAVHKSRDDEAREHPRKSCAIPIKFESENQKFKGIAKEVSVGGAFIKTADTVAVGQRIILEIPLKKKGKIVRLIGRIAWSSRQGFGVKFIPQNK